MILIIKNLKTSIWYRKDLLSVVYFQKENLSVYVLSGQGESLSSVTPDQKLISRNNERKKTPSSYVLRKEPIGDTVNPRKISQEDTVIDQEKDCQHKI